MIRSQFVRQMLGAIGGAVLAYMLYAGYGMAKDALTARTVDPRPVIQEQAYSSTHALLPVLPTQGFSSVSSNTSSIAFAPMQKETKVAAATDDLKAPELPSSGVGLWLAGGVAFLLAALSTLRLKAALAKRIHGGA